MTDLVYIRVLSFGFMVLRAAMHEPVFWFNIKGSRLYNIKRFKTLPLIRLCCKREKRKSKRNGCGD